MSRFEIYRATDAGAPFGSFLHSRTAFVIILLAEVKRFVRACLLPIQDLDRVIESEGSARIYAIPKCPAIGARE